MNAAVMVFAGSDWAKMGLSMWFFWIAFCGAVLLGVMALFGHGDHDIDHDIDHDVDHDHDAGHDSEHGGSGNLSFFSFRVIVMFVIGFGCGGFFGAHAGLEVVGSSMVGICSGFVLGFLTWALMNYLYKHQGSSAVKTKNLIGCEASVTIPIASDGMGEIVCEVGGSQVWLPAKSTTRLPINTRVKVTEAYGSSVTVEPLG